MLSFTSFTSSKLSACQHLFILWWNLRESLFQVRLGFKQICGIDFLLKHLLDPFSKPQMHYKEWRKFYRIITSEIQPDTEFWIFSFSLKFTMHNSNLASINYLKYYVFNFVCIKLSSETVMCLSVILPLKLRKKITADHILQTKTNILTV